MLSKKKRIAAVLMTVVMIITAVNFFPFGTYRTVKQERYSAGAQAEEQAEKTDTVTEAEEAAEQENETAVLEEQESELTGETMGTSETEVATEEEIVTEAATEEQESEPELIYEEVPDMQAEPGAPVEEELVVLNAGATATVTSRQDVSYGPSYGHSYIVNDGSVGYSAYCCAKDNNNTPGVGNSGTVTDITEWGNGPAYRRIFYFGCLPAYSFDSEAQRVLAVSQTLSAYYSGTSNTFSAFDNATKGFTVPSASVSVTAPTSTQVTIEGNLQKTGNYTISADGHASVSVTIPDGVTLYSGGNAYTGTASLGNGAQFYLTAPLDTTGTLTGTVTGGQTVNRVYLLDFGGSTQQLMFADWVTPSASYSATFSVPRGNLEIKKTSANQEITNGNPCYSLKGAVYTLYKNTADANANRNVVTTLTTDADGYAKADNLELGNYILKETKNPPGYALDTRLYPVTITADQTTAFKINLTDMPQMDPVFLLLTKQNENGTKLAGAEYAFKFYSEEMSTDPAKTGKSPQRTWILKTDNDGFVALDNLYKVSGDNFYYAINGDPMLPLGTLTIQETKAPEGYLIDNTVYVRQITSSGTAEAVSTYNAPTVIERQIRGDIAFTKKDEATGEPIGSVKFSITDEAGESHIIWTDENGYYSTASAYAAHSKNTNSGNAGDGIWFGSTAVDDSLGALPYGTYTIKELRCEANKNKYKDLAAFTVEVEEHGTVVNYGDVLNERFPAIMTSVTDTFTGTNIASYGAQITAVDTVALQNLEAGHEYTLTGVIMDKETGEELLQDGSAVTASKSFAADAEDMSVNMEYTVKTEGLAGKDIVVFEYLYDAAYPDELVASHADIEDEGQTLHFPEIKTTAENAVSGNQIALPTEKTTITDHVTYSNLIPGKAYTIKTVLMDRETGEPVTVNGEQVTEETVFTPEQEAGTVDVSITFDASLLAGHTTVVFENVYYEGKLVALHADIEDDDQTVWFPEIHTTATDSKTGTHEALAGKETTIVDMVAYKNLIPGKEYTLNGTIMDKETGKTFEADGKPVTASESFTPEQADGTVEMSFTFDASALAGKDIVIFEDMYHEDRLIAMHADIEDDGQTISFPEIKTTATDMRTGTHEGELHETVTIRDVVEYKNLIPGKVYTLKGSVMERMPDGTEAELIINGEKQTAEVTFVAESESGTVEMYFNLDGNKLAGKTTVIFEELYHDGIMIAVHADINDEGQTVTFPPYTPPTPPTGDSTPIKVIMLLTMLSLVSIAGLILMRKKSNRE